MKPKLFGADYSVYVRIARLSFHEKGVDYELVPVDIFAPGGPPAAYLERQPFGKIPAFEHEGFRLYETGAITRYVDEAFEGAALQPENPRQRARMNQIVSIADEHVYPDLVWGLYVELVSKAEGGKPSSKDRVAEAWAKAPVCLKALSDILEDNPWLAGDHLTLADLHVAPMVDYFLRVPDAGRMLSDTANLARWWDRMSARESFLLTGPTS